MNLSPKLLELLGAVLKVAVKIYEGDELGAFVAAKSLGDMAIQYLPADPAGLTEAGVQRAETAADIIEAVKVGG